MRIVAITSAAIAFFTAAVYCPQAHAFAVQPLISSPEQQQELLAHRNEITQKLHLGPNKMWSLIGLVFSIAVLMELLLIAKKDPDFMAVFGNFLVAILLGLVIYDLFGLIEGLMNSLARSISGGTSYWESVVASAKSLAETGESKWEKVWIIFKALWTNVGNPLGAVLQGINFVSYLFVLVMLKVITVVQQTILTYLHAVAPIVVALSVLPNFNLVSPYFLLIISVSSWSLFGAIIGKVMSVVAGQSLFVTSISDLVANTLSNVTGGFAIFAAAALATAVFHGGGSLGSILGKAMNLTVGVAQTAGSLLAGAAIGGLASLAGAGGGTAKAAVSGAVSGAMLGPSGAINTLINPAQNLRSFVQPKKPSEKQKGQKGGGPDNSPSPSKERRPRRKERK